MKSFGVGGIGGPIHGLHDGLRRFLNLFDDGGKAVGLRGLAVVVGEGGRNETLLDVAIEQRAHARRQLEGGKKILVQAAAADDVKIFVAHGEGADYGEGERHAVRQLFFFKESL